MTQAYSQLVTEGYLAGRTGSATRVCWSPAPDDDRIAHQVSHAGATTPPQPVRFDLSQCQPDFQAFPRQKWVDAIRIAAQTAQFDQLGASEPGGEPRLRTSRQRFRARRAALMAALERSLPGSRVSGAETGVHLLLELPPGSDAAAILAEAAAVRHG